VRFDMPESPPLADPAVHSKSLDHQAWTTRRQARILIDVLGTPLKVVGRNRGFSIPFQMNNRHSNDT
jgi:hypothetical protein